MELIKEPKGYCPEFHHVTLQYPANFLHFLQSENIGSPDGDPIRYKAIQTWLKVDRVVATESWKFRTGWWTDNQIFRKMHRFKTAILLYLSSMESKIHEIEKDTIVILSCQVNEAFCCTKGLYETKN